MHKIYLIRLIASEAELFNFLVGSALNDIHNSSTLNNLNII